MTANVLVLAWNGICVSAADVEEEEEIGERGDERAKNVKRNVNERMEIFSSEFNRLKWVIRVTYIASILLLYTSRTRIRMFEWRHPKPIITAYVSIVCLYRLEFNIITS